MCRPFAIRSRRVRAAFSTPIVAVAVSAPQTTADWTHLSADPARTGTTPGTIPSLAAPLWVCSHDLEGLAIEFVAPASPVVGPGLVYAPGRSGGVDHLYAIDRAMGVVVWQSTVDTPAVESWASPAVDAPNNAVVYASGQAVRSFDASTGEPLWTAELDKPTGNSSPLITADLAPANRLFVVDDDGFGFAGGGTLYCINVDPFHAALNPHQPGDIVWKRSLVNATSGATPAYADGIVVVADAGSFVFNQPGRVSAFDASSDGDAGTGPEPIWTTTNPLPYGFYAGVSIDTTSVPPAVYAASYNFNGGANSSNLIRMDLRTGQLRWSIPAGRTSAIPLPVGDGRVVLSSGLIGFGSRPTVQVFQDLGNTAQLAADVSVDTWIDANGNSAIDPGEYLMLAGWTHHAAIAHTPSGPRLLVGADSRGSGFFQAFDSLYELDLDARFDPSLGFIAQLSEGAGSSPAFDAGQVFTIGPGGLHAFASPSARINADVNADGIVDLEDLYAWELGEGSLDVNADGTADGTDRLALVAALRLEELSRMLGGGTQ
ncbi:MAG: outer membrane protein assembly factor BamB family protein [Phycisphaerales bacterium]